jgi:sodium-coupled neutral amino acid transporter 11
MISTSLVWGALLISLTTCDLGAVFELIGATSACVLAYILPPACWLKLTTKGGWERWAAKACVGFGCVVMGISLVQAVTKMITGGGGTATCS